MLANTTLKSAYKILAAAALLLSPSLSALDLNNAVKGQVFEVKLKDLLPTQPSVGFDQIYYKLGRFEQDLKKQLDEICETNGQKGIKQFNINSQADLPGSFKCRKPVGSRIDEMKTVVIAPDNHLYLTDGHHTLNTFWHMPGGGQNFALHVLIKNDYRNLNSMDSFWQAMKTDKNIWLFDSENKPLDFSELPQSLGLINFSDDVYRSMMYFTRDTAWEKPKHPIPFLEFYWGQSLRSNINLSSYDLLSMQGYLKAVKDSSATLLSLNDTNLSGSGRSVQQMGLLEKFNHKAFDKLSSRKSKLNYMLVYKTALNTK
ncbi:ParB/Srx family N-terminal domain-containing protein [Psychromonas ossibalaenae]|uniref:ParB/Srx family N-terminal domain-containing protein n=1 Tax=Psychromonas ossibalaenae TaxID=444922 RepID=UPI000361B673|nr:ParB/Srx family N-terminal domain-containing protein [Psychromonas ossibalaenae]